MATARPKGKGYEIRVFCGLDVNAKRIDKAKMWIPADGMKPKQIEKELERQKILFEQEVRQGVLPDCNIKFYDFAKRWMEEYGKVNLAIKTYSRYEIYLQRINEAIGHIKLKDLKPLHLNSFYRNLEEDGVNKKTHGKLAPKTVLEHHRVVSKILATAVKWQLLEQNIATRADPPKVPHREISYLNELEAKRMILALENEPVQYRTMVIVLIYTGIRRGELCGLEWKDIDFKNQSMRVVRSSQYIGNRTYITKEPKTKAGIREFSLSSTVCEILQGYRQWQMIERMKCGDQWQESDRLFTQWNGAPIHPDTITDWFSKFIAKNGFPHVTLHSLRHTNATLMIAEGTDVCTVSRRLGHANTSTTLNVYAHALRSKDTEAADKLENALDLKLKAVSNA